MFEQFLMPFECQFDGGFQATADAFKEAAEALSAEHENKANIFNGHLPVNFLLRHSIELFLKSMITTVHRALRLPTAEA